MSIGQLNYSRYSGSYSSSFNLILSSVYGFTTGPAVGFRKMLISIQSDLCIISNNNLTKEEREKGISYALPDS